MTVNILVLSALNNMLFQHTLLTTVYIFSIKINNAVSTQISNSVTNFKK